MIHFIKGNLLDSKENYICHQVNCMGRMGSGVAAQIREKWPIVYKDYKNLLDFWLSPKEAFGHSQFCKVNVNQYVINMYAQYNYGTNPNRLYTDYEAFKTCLKEIADAHVGTIAFPKYIGCGLGNGDWDIILSMIEKELSDREVYIYEL